MNLIARSILAAAAAVTVAVTHVHGHEGVWDREGYGGIEGWGGLSHLEGWHLAQGKGTAWVLQMDDPQDPGQPFFYPRPFPTQAACEAYLASDGGRAMVLQTLVNVFVEYGPDYKVGAPLCRQQVMDLSRLPGEDA